MKGELLQQEWSRAGCKTDQIRCCRKGMDLTNRNRNYQKEDDGFKRLKEAKRHTIQWIIEQSKQYGQLEAQKARVRGITKVSGTDGPSVFKCGQHYKLTYPLFMDVTTI